MSSRTCSRGKSSGASSSTHCSTFRARTSGDLSSIDVILGPVELTESGGGVEYFTVIDRGDGEIDLSGFTLNAVDRETGKPDDATAGIQIIGAVRLVPGQEVSLRRTPDLVDADDDQMVGTFAGGELLTVKAGDQISLLDDCGAVVDTSSV
jgi:hypothetical protein